MFSFVYFLFQIVIHTCRGIGIDLLKAGGGDAHLRFEAVDKVTGVGKAYRKRDFRNILFGTDEHTFCLTDPDVIQVFVETFSRNLFEMCGKIRLPQSEFFGDLDRGEFFGIVAGYIVENVDELFADAFFDLFFNGVDGVDLPDQIEKQVRNIDPDGKFLGVSPFVIFFHDLIDTFLDIGVFDLFL